MNDELAWFFDRIKETDSLKFQDHILDIVRKNRISLGVAPKGGVLKAGAFYLRLLFVHIEIELVGNLTSVDVMYQETKKENIVDLKISRTFGEDFYYRVKGIFHFDEGVEKSFDSFLKHVRETGSHESYYIAHPNVITFFKEVYGDDFIIYDEEKPRGKKRRKNSTKRG